MTDTNETEGGAGSYEIGPWDVDGVARVTATGADEEAILNAGLAAVVAAARRLAVAPMAAPPPEEPEDAASAAAPIRGQGKDLAAVFTELAADLLAQLDAHGTGLDHVRLDGVLETDEGGFTAWGYALGTPADDPPPVGLSLDGDPTLTATPDGPTLRFALRREPSPTG